MPTCDKQKMTEALCQPALSQISLRLRIPLDGVNSSMQQLQVLRPEIEELECWDRMTRELHELELLLNGLSAYSSGEQLTISRIDPKEFAWDLKDSLLPELLRRHIPLLIRLDDTYPDFYGDPSRLKQAFTNLIQNSMEAISGRGRITLKVYAYEKRLMIAVRDNGCGIPAELQQDIFRPFFTHRKGGAGLGLPIARRIICAHGGTLRLRSEAGKGTEIQVYLPLRPATGP